MDRHRKTDSLDQLPPTLQSRVQRRLWILFIVFMCAGGIYGAVNFRSPTSQAKQPLDGKLIIYVRSSQRGEESKPIEQAGALPVRANGIMSLEANFSQPARAYFVWFDCEGRVLPLYPWNYDTLEVTDINQPPPTRIGAKVIYSPPIGGGWTFGKKGGIETVLLLARREPLDSNVSLGPLLNLPPSPKMQHREELVGLKVNRGDESVSTLFSNNRGKEEESRAADEQLITMMAGLREHFELIRVVRFTHEEGSQTDNK